MRQASFSVTMVLWLWVAIMLAKRAVVAVLAAGLLPPNAAVDALLVGGAVAGMAWLVLRQWLARKGGLK